MDEGLVEFESVDGFEHGGKDGVSFCSAAVVGELEDAEVVDATGFDAGGVVPDGLDGEVSAEETDLFDGDAGGHEEGFFPDGGGDFLFGAGFDAVSAKSVGDEFPDGGVTDVFDHGWGEGFEGFSAGEDAGGVGGAIDGFLVEGPGDFSLDTVGDVNGVDGVLDGGSEVRPGVLEDLSGAFGSAFVADAGQMLKTRTVGQGDDDGIDGVVAVVLAVFEVEAVVSEDGIEAPVPAELGGELPLGTDDVGTEGADVLGDL